MVIGVIGLLAGLLLAAVSKAKDSGRSTYCRNRLRQIGIALQMYSHDEKGLYPHYLGPAGSSFGDDKGQSGRATGLIYWSSKLRPYGVIAWTNRAFHCPGYAGEISGPWQKGSADRLGSYAYNTMGVRTANPGSFRARSNTVLGDSAGSLREGSVRIAGRCSKRDVSNGRRAHEGGHEGSI